MLQSNNPIRFGFPEIAESGDILINEFLFNPFEGSNDFVELINGSKKIIDLKDWEVSITDYNDSNQIKDAALISKDHRLLFPGEILVLTEDDKKVRAYYICNGTEAFLNVASMPDFNSDKGRVVIFDQSGNVIDAFRYSEEMHFPLLSDTKGVSLERLSISEITDNKLNWHSAAATVGFATPGYVNSQRVESVGNDDEVNLGMEIFSPDNDGYDDVLTIHYQFPQAGTVLSLNVFDFNGQPVRTLLNGQTISNEGTLIWDGLTNGQTIASSGIYVLLARCFDLNGNEKVIKKSFFLTRSK